MCALPLPLSCAAVADEAAAASPPAVPCPRFDRLEARYRRRFVDPMTAWSQHELSDFKGHSVLYLFSGPDVVTAMSMFPDCVETWIP